MNETRAAHRAGLAPHLERRVGFVVGWVARISAILGGVALVAITVMTVVSVSGRALIDLGLRPIPGDFELVELGTAFAVFAFLPWCQYRRGHVTVDIAVMGFGPRTRASFSLVGNFLLTLAATLIAWRLYDGLQDKMRYGETTFILQLPAWWGYAVAFVGACAFAAVSAYTVWRSLNETLGPGEPSGGPEGTEFGE